MTSDPAQSATTPAPPQAAPPPPVRGTRSLIPTRNPPALVGYYLAVFSLIPVLGAPLGIAAFWCGVVGLGRVRRDPSVHGRTHAWVALVLGAVTAIAWSAVILFVVVAMSRAPRPE